MEINVYSIDITGKKEFNYYLASDLHCDHPDFSESFFRKEFNEAMDMECKIYINGDIFDVITTRDKRYTPSAVTSRTDAIINDSLDRAVGLLSPYADNIDMIGQGNHESSILKFNNIDIISILINRLNQKRNKKLYPIVHGGYEGYIRHVYGSPNRKKNNRGGGLTKTVSYDIWYNHGQGGSGSEVTKGSIDLHRRQYVMADLLWLGHKHRRKIDELDPCLSLNNRNNPVFKEKKGVITGCFFNRRRTYDIKTEKYQSNFGEEKCRVPIAQGGAFLKVRYHREHKKAPQLWSRISI